CVQEHPIIQWGIETFGERVQWLGVVYEDTEENAQAFLRSHPTGYPQMLDANGSMAVDYGVTGVPETYFIDRDGVIRGKWANPIDPRRMRSCIEEITGPVELAAALRCVSHEPVAAGAE